MQFGRSWLHPWCISGPHLIPRKGGLEESVGFYGSWPVYSGAGRWQQVPQTAPHQRCFGLDKDIPVILGKGLSKAGHGGLILTASPSGWPSGGFPSPQGAGGDPLACPQPAPSRRQHGPGLLWGTGLCPSLRLGSLPLSSLFPHRGTGFMGRDSSWLPQHQAVIVSLWVALDQRWPEQLGHLRQGIGAVFWQEGE